MGDRLGSPVPASSALPNLVQEREHTVSPYFVRCRTLMRLDTEENKVWVVVLMYSKHVKEVSFTHSG